MIPSVPTVPFATASKKQQPYQRSFKKVLVLPQILIVAVALLSLVQYKRSPILSKLV